MVELAIQKFLRRNSLRDAVNEWGLRVQEDDDLVMLNYDMADTPPGVPECDDCRGLILDRRDDYKVVALPFRRFFNIWEPHAAQFRDSVGRLQEKLDGTLCTYYWNPRRENWCVSTRGRIYADGPVYNHGMTFNELFLEAVQLGKVGLLGVPQNINLVFELTSPHNRIVTPYDETRIRLIGARDISTMLELNDTQLDDISAHINVQRPWSLSCNDLNQAQEALDEVKMLDEGFVWVDYSCHKYTDFPRIKFKNRTYLDIAHVVSAGNGGPTDKRIISAILSGGADEIISYFPELKNRFDDIQHRMDSFISCLESHWASIQHLGDDRRVFAAEAKKCRYPAAMFQMLDNKSDSVEEFVRDLPPSKIVELI